MSFFDNFYQNISQSKTKLYFFIGFLISIVIILLVVIFVSLPTDQPAVSQDDSHKDFGFPSFPDSGGNQDYFKYLSGLDASQLMFAHFYEEPKIDINTELETYSLPINIKVDAANYYDVSRKMNLEPFINDFNKNGFAVMPNQFKSSANDFFAVYSFLDKKEIPKLLTTDFLFYYYQNKLKEVYKDIKTEAFYPNIWNVFNSLFEVASKRYLQKYNDVGMENDNILEGARLESAFLAVVLELLKPEPGQINKQPGLKQENMFTPEGAREYDFVLPEYLKDDVKKEVKLIKSAGKINRSPVFRYPINYKKYRIPAGYRNNAKLRNFYLALKWLNTVFPLYYRTEDCPDCLLDRSDWTVNMAAAGFLSKDMASNQQIKNEWAVIYKFISFFSGLRQDLTYIDYDRVLSELYGKNYNIENVLNRDQFVGVEILELQKKLSEISFSAIEGMLDRQNGKNPQIGLRILQLPYWPNNYIFKYLSGKDFDYLNEYNGPKARNITSCSKNNYQKTTYRCNAIAMDVINLISPINNNPYFSVNTDYANYRNKSGELKNIFDNFTSFTWNNNIYWASLDIIKRVFLINVNSYPVYMRGKNWQKEKTMNTALGAWVNIHLPMDKIVGNFSKSANGLGSVNNCDENNYLEINPYLVAEMQAKSKMLKQMLEVLNVSDQTNQISIELDDLNNLLENILTINKKILQGKILDYTDCEYMQTLTNNYRAAVKAEKSFSVSPGGEGRRGTNESIRGVKLLGVIYQKKRKKIIAIGPIFNYHEGR